MIPTTTKTPATAPVFWRSDFCCTTAAAVGFAYTCVQVIADPFELVLVDKTVTKGGVPTEVVPF